MLPKYDWSVGCTFKKSIRGNPNPHLHIIFAQSPIEPRLCMVAFLSRTKNKRIHSAETRLYPGDHNFITEESYLVYALTSTYYYAEVSPEIIEFQERLSLEVLRRIQSSCLFSRYLPKGLQRQFCNWYGIKYMDTFMSPYM